MVSMINHESSISEYLGLSFQLPANARPTGQYVVTETVGSLSPTWETETEFLVPGFNLAQLGLCGHLKSELTNRRSLPLFLL